MASLRTIVGIIALASLPGLMSCAVVDQYSGRAVAYNVEAEQAQEQALLLNVVRAYLRRPMQFTTVSSITGAASATGGVGYTAPVNIPFRPITNGSSIAAFPPLNTWSMSAGMSGGPTFTVPVLDTQEFYQGIMRPIPGALYDLYNQSDYPRDLLFNLFVSRVVMTLDEEDCRSTASASHKTGKSRKPVEECEFVFHNYVGNEVELQLFQALGDYLMYLGLSTEPTPRIKDYFDKAEKKGSKENSKLFGVEVKLTGASSSGGSSDLSGGSGQSNGGGGQARSYGFCFSPRTPDAARNVPDTHFWCTAIKAGNGDDDQAASDLIDSTPKGRATSPKVETQDVDIENRDKDDARIKQTGYATGKIRASSAFIAKLLGIAQDRTIINADPDMAKDLAKFADQKVYLSFYLRSVEAMIYYLGEVSRRQLNPEFGENSRQVFIKNPPRYAPYPTAEPCKATNSICVPIFVLKKDFVPEHGDFLSILYDETRFTVPSMTTGGGYSTPVLEIVKQQLALNSSAKALPQSNVISVVGQ
jgi:uncharacterized membrane protein YgcG